MKGLVVLLAGLTQVRAGTPAPPVHPARDPVRIESGALRLDFDDRLWTRVVASFDGRETTLGPYRASESLTVAGKEVTDFAHVSDEERPIEDAFGRGRRLTIVGRADALGIEKTVTVDVRDAFPRLALVTARYRNVGRAELKVGGWTGNAHALSAGVPATKPPFWSYQTRLLREPARLGASAQEGLHAGELPGHERLRLRRRHAGRGRVAARRRARGRPPERRAEAGVPARGHAEARRKRTLAVPRDAASARSRPARAFDTLRTFVAVHRGDHFQALADYRRLMVAPGHRPARSARQRLRADLVRLGLRPRVHRRPGGGHAARGQAPRLRAGPTLDDGWQVAEGDWVPVPSQVPARRRRHEGARRRIHAAGPEGAALVGAARRGSRHAAPIAEHPDQLLLDGRGHSRARSPGGTRSTCAPRMRPVREDARAFCAKALAEWGFDGLKIDGQHLNGAPPCHNAGARITRAPEESVEGMPGFFKAICDAALAREARRASWRSAPAAPRTRSSPCPSSTWPWPPTRRARGRCGSRARR